MKTTRYFVKQGSNVHLVKMNPEVSSTTLTPKVYSVNFSEMAGFFLTELKDRYDLEGKIYGDTNRRSDKIVKTFSHGKSSLGVLLTGNKGSGKTMLTQVIANKIIDENRLPIITVSQPYKGDDFNRFINDIGECVVVFDEFGKMYDRDDDQDYLLTFMDGSMSQKRLILLTENDKYMISSYMMNRPGRILYHFEYSRLQSQVVRELCMDSGLAEETAEEIIQSTSTVNELNMDIVKAIIAEVKLHTDEQVAGIVDDMNIQNKATREFYKVIKLVEADGTEHDRQELEEPNLRNTLNFPDTIVDDSFAITYYTNNDNDDNAFDDNDCVPATLSSSIDDGVTVTVSDNRHIKKKKKKHIGFSFESHFHSSDGTVFILEHSSMGGIQLYLKREINYERFIPGPF